MTINQGTERTLTISYNDLSQRTQVSYSNGCTIAFTPQLDDDIGAITHSFVGSSVTFSYGYNAVNEPTSVNISDGAYMFHPSAASTAYSTADDVNKYPAVGGVSTTYDSNMNLTGDGVWTYSYDTENHLLSASKTGVSASFVYDGMERQSQKTVGSVKSRYIYSAWQRIADYDGTSGNLQNRYIYGQSMDEPFIQVSSAGVLTFLHADKLGSIVATSDGAGAVTNINSFGPFGEISTLGGTSFGFTGQRYDPELELHYFKRRYYSSKLGRFLQPDPIGYTGVDLNLYSYVRNSPLLFTDPMGEHCSCEDTVSSAINAIINMLQPGLPAGVSGSGVSPNDLYDKCVKDCRRDNAGDAQAIANCIWQICSQYNQKGNGQKPKNSAGTYAPEPLIFLKSGVGAPLGGWGILEFYDEETRNAILAFQGLTSVYTANGVFLGYL